MLESAHESNPWAKPPSTATKQTTNVSTPFLKHYSFHIDPTRDDEHVLMTKAITTDTKLDTTTTTQNMEDKKSSGENSKESATTGSPRTGSPTKNPGATGNIEDIWKKESGPESLAQTMGRRRNELSSDDEIDEGSGTRLGNGESKAGFISRRPSMTAELETRMRQVRLSEGSDPHGQSGPSSPSATSKWGLYGMNWNTQSTILGDRNTTPPQQDLVQPPISPLARFQHSPFDPPVPRQLSPTNTSQPFSPHSRFPPPPTATAAAPLDPNQRVQRSQSFSLGDHSYGATYSVANAPVGHRPSLFADDKSTTVGTRSFKPSSAFPASPLARDSIEEEVDDFDATLRQATSSKDDSPSRYQDRGRSLSTSAASHAFTRQRGSEAEDLIDEALYEEDEEAEQEFEPLSRSRTLPTEHNMSGTLPGGALGAYGGSSRFAGLANTERERLERQRAPMRQSPRIVEDIPPVRRQDSFSQAAWDSASAVRSPPRSVDYPGVASNFDSFEQSSMVDSPGSMHSFPGAREYAGPSDVQNYFNNDLDRRRQAEHQMQLYQMQNRFRSPVSYPPHDGARPFSFHDPDQYTLHFVKFKANRMDVFYLAKEKKLDLQVKDYVIVDGDRGTDLGMVSKVNVTEAEARALTAQLQREQAAATAANQNGMNANAIEAIAAAANQVSERDVTIPKKFIHRLAVRGEIDGLQMKMQDEAQAKQVCEMKVQQRGLQMDILDVEYQWDRRKLYIYFIAPQRVDFVALVKDLFKIYKTRIWLHNSTASHVTSQLASQPSFHQASQQQEHPEYGVPHLQPQYDYFRSGPRQSPGQQQYLPMQPQPGPMYSPPGGYYSPPSQQYYPPRTYPQPPPPPPPMPFQSSGPPPPGQW